MRFLKEHGLPGTLICVEGIDGSGKSTQIGILRDWLKSKNLDVIYTEWNSSDLISQTTKRAKKKNLLKPFACCRFCGQTGTDNHTCNESRLYCSRR